MIEQYSFGSIVIHGKRYTSDLKIINGQVYPDWWRKSGHLVAVEDVTDMLNAKPDYIVIGSGSAGLMNITDRLKRYFKDCGIKVVEEPTSTAIETYNRMYEGGKNVAAGFHLTC